MTIQVGAKEASLPILGQIFTSNEFSLSFLLILRGKPSWKSVGPKYGHISKSPKSLLLQFSMNLSECFIIDVNMIFVIYANHGGFFIQAPKQIKPKIKIRDVWILDSNFIWGSESKIHHDEYLRVSDKIMEKFRRSRFLVNLDIIDLPLNINRNDRQNKFKARILKSGQNC